MLLILTALGGLHCVELITQPVNKYQDEKILILGNLIFTENIVNVKSRLKFMLGYFPL